MHNMLGIAVYFTCGATACYLLGRRIKEGADYFNSITRLIDLQLLDDLLTDKTTNLLVVVSGRVASATPFECKNNGPLSVLLEEKAEMDLEIKLEDGGMIKKTMSYLLQRKETPWYLEDSTGRVNIEGAQYAVGFGDTLNEYRPDIPATELFEKFVKPQGSKILAHAIYGRALNIGTFLTFIGEAVRDKAGNVVIRKPNGQSFKVFSGEGSFDKMVTDITSKSETYIFMSKIFGTIAVAVAVMYGVDFIRRDLLPLVLKKMDSCEGSESDSEEETHQGEE